MVKIIRVSSCRECFYVRNLSLEKYPYCCIKKAMMTSSSLDKEDTIQTSFLKNIKKIPSWCPLQEEKK